MADYLPFSRADLREIENSGQYGIALAADIRKSSGMIGDILLSIFVDHLQIVADGDNPLFWLERLEDIIAQAKEGEGVG